jgi:hypothetical protein
MAAEAHVTTIWKNQKLFVSLALIAIAGWFFVDGKWTWPRSNVRWKAHDQYEKEKRLGEWPAFAASQGWKAEPPEKYYDRDQIMVQFLIATFLGAAGGLTLIYWARQRDRVLRLEGEVVHTPAGVPVPLTAITGLGLKKWEAKGLATVRYEIEGRKGQFILDDYKFDRDPTHEIMKVIEDHLRARSGETAA